MCKMIVVRLHSGEIIEGTNIKNANGNIYIEGDNGFSKSVKPSEILSIFLHGLDDALFYNVMR